MDPVFSESVKNLREWFASSRYEGITRLYSARQVAEQRGTILHHYAIAETASKEFFGLLRTLFSEKRSITTFGPYSPGQAVMMRRQGIQGIYLGGWATSAKGSDTEDPGSDLASYPLSRVPEEAANIVRALVAADRNQYYARARMTDDQRKKTPTYDFRPFIIADADTGHGGDAHVRNLIRRFVEAGISGYHIEDQKPGAKKCGHQGGKVLVSVDEQIKRLNTARFQLDVMGVEGIIVARTDAEAATLLESMADERDHPFILGATNPDVPPYKDCYLNVLRLFYAAGAKDINGHLLYKISEKRYAECDRFFNELKLMPFIREKTKDAAKNEQIEVLFNEVLDKFAEAWEACAGVKTYRQAVYDSLKSNLDDGVKFEIAPDQWMEFADTASFAEAREKARSFGVDLFWDPERARTPDGYYQVQGSLEYATARSLAVAPFADILWMETKTADLKEAKKFANAIHAQFPKKMLAYNLSPSFNWDTTGMSDDEMREFPKELGKLGYVFNFITYGGHQIDGLAAEEFSLSLIQNGMLALANLQRRLRLIDSPYKTPQTLVGGNRFDSALTASSGRTASTKAMGKGSTQFQHLVQTEVPIKLLDQWLALWLKRYGINESLSAKLRPLNALSDLLELSVLDGHNEVVANVTFANIQDRQGRSILSVRNQGTQKLEFRQKRLMTLMQSFLVHRYKSISIHYLSPTDDNHRAVDGMKKLGFFDVVKSEVGDIIVARVNKAFIQKLLEGEENIIALIGK